MTLGKGILSKVNVSNIDAFYFILPFIHSAIHPSTNKEFIEYLPFASNSSQQMRHTSEQNKASTPLWSTHTGGVLNNKQINKTVYLMVISVMKVNKEGRE